MITKHITTNDDIYVRPNALATHVNVDDDINVFITHYSGNWVTFPFQGNTYYLRLNSSDPFIIRNKKEKTKVDDGLPVYMAFGFSAATFGYGGNFILGSQRVGVGLDIGLSFKSYEFDVDTNTNHVPIPDSIINTVLIGMDYRVYKNIHGNAGLVIVEDNGAGPYVGITFYSKKDIPIYIKLSQGIIFKDKNATPITNITFGLAIYMANKEKK